MKTRRCPSPLRTITTKTENVVRIQDRRRRKRKASNIIESIRAIEKNYFHDKKKDIKKQITPYKHYIVTREGLESIKMFQKELQNYINNFYNSKNYYQMHINIYDSALKRLRL